MKEQTRVTKAEMAEATSRFCSGESGGWAKKFTAEQSAAMDELYAQQVLIEAPGLQFDFEEIPLIQVTMTGGESKGSHLAARTGIMID